MIISMLYWRSQWMQCIQRESSKPLTHSHSVEERRAFERRLASLRNAKFSTAPPRSEDARIQAYENEVKP